MKWHNKFLNLIILSSIFYIPLAQAWRLTFAEDQVIDDSYNREIIEHLLLLLPHYPSDANPTLKFTFHQNKNSQKRWENLSKQIPALKNYPYEIYNTPDTDALSIHLKQTPTDTCPAQITIKDPQIPSQTVNFPVSGSGVFVLSEQATIEILGKKRTVQIALYNRQKNELRQIKSTYSFYLEGAETQEPLSVGIFSPTDLSDSQTEIVIKKAWQKNTEEFSSKGATVSPIPISSLLFNFEKTEKISNACFLHLKPLSK